MQKFILLWNAVLLSFTIYSATEKLSLLGFYNGENPIVVNPYQKDRFSVEKIEINNQFWPGDVQTSTIEVDMQMFNLRIGDFISLVIYYNNELPKPYVYNLASFQQLTNFSFINPKVDKKSEKITWKVKTVHPQCHFEIEQYRWNSWIKIGQINISDSISYLTYAVDFNPHSGKNLLRIAYVTPFGGRIYSDYIMYTSKTLPVNIQKIASTYIAFSASTFYQIYNEEGKLVKEDMADKADISDLPPGQYFLSYDTEVIDFKKK